MLCLPSSQPQGTLELNRQIAQAFISPLRKLKKQFFAFSAANDIAQAANDIAHRLQRIEWIASNVIYFIQEIQLAPKVTWRHPHCSSIWSIAQNFSSKVRVIFVWPWNENARTKQKQQTNGNRAIWLVYRTDTNALGFWLVRRTLGWKNFMPDN